MPLVLGSREIAGHFSPPLLSPLEKQDAQDDTRMNTKKDPKAQPGQIHSSATYNPA